MKLSQFRVDLENGRLEQPVIKRYHETTSTVAAAGTTTLNITNGNIFILTQDTNITTLNVTNPSTASNTATSITIIRVKDATGTARTITWPAAFKWAGATQPTLTQTASAIDIISAFTTDGGTTYYAFASGLNLS